MIKNLINMLLCAFLFPLPEGQPIALHPENPHYFIFRGKPLVVVTSGEHYGAVLNPDFDYLKYLNTLEKDGQLVLESPVFRDDIALRITRK